MVNKIFPVGYAANFRRFCLFCIYDAKVQIFPELCKKNGNYFFKSVKIFKYAFIQIRQEGFQLFLKKLTKKILLLYIL